MARELTAMAYYRGHTIVVLQDQPLTAEIIELATSALLPTKVLAMPGEGVDIVIKRAKDLVDRYLQER